MSANRRSTETALLTRSTTIQCSLDRLDSLMMWQLQTAKQKFSALVELALSEGPQVVTRHGRAVVVVLGIDDYRRLREGEPDFKRFLVDAPNFDLLEIERPGEVGRAVDL
jgi:prevent-host-death family protein